jgi:hypothetical protein
MFFGAIYRRSSPIYKSKHFSKYLVDNKKTESPDTGHQPRLIPGTTIIITFDKLYPKDW